MNLSASFHSSYRSSLNSGLHTPATWSTTPISWTPSTRAKWRWFGCRTTCCQPNTPPRTTGGCFKGLSGLGRSGISRCIKTIFIGNLAAKYVRYVKQKQVLGIKDVATSNGTVFHEYVAKVFSRRVSGFRNQQTSLRSWDHWNHGQFTVDFGEIPEKMEHHLWPRYHFTSFLFLVLFIKSSSGEQKMVFGKPGRSVQKYIYIYTYTYFIDMLGNIFFHTTGWRFFLQPCFCSQTHIWVG